MRLFIVNSAELAIAPEQRRKAFVYLKPLSLFFLRRCKGLLTHVNRSLIKSSSRHHTQREHERIRTNMIRFIYSHGRGSHKNKWIIFNKSWQAFFSYCRSISTRRSLYSCKSSISLKLTKYYCWGLSVDRANGYEGMELIPAACKLRELMDLCRPIFFSRSLLTLLLQNGNK